MELTNKKSITILNLIILLIIIILILNYRLVERYWVYPLMFILPPILAVIRKYRLISLIILYILIAVLLFLVLYVICSAVPGSL